MLYAMIVLALWAAVCSGLAGGFFLLWLHERGLRETAEGVRRLDAASDRYDGAYTRAELTRAYERSGRL